MDRRKELYPPDPCRAPRSSVMLEQLPQGFLQEHPPAPRETLPAGGVTRGTLLSLLIISTDTLSKYL